MDLDDQLAALAAGELDDATARAVRARAAADPALARQLARHQRLEELLTEWQVPDLSDEAAARLDARVEEALDALGDGPLTEAPAPSVAPAPRPAKSEGSSPTTPVADLQAARRRRGERGTGGTTGGAVAWPSWGPAAAVAAALAAVVGTGIVLGGLPGGVGLDTMAQDDSGEESAVTEQADETEQPDEAELSADSPVDAGGATQSSGPARRAGVEVAEGELLALVDGDMTITDTADEDAGTDGEAQDSTADLESGPEHACVVEALERDTAPADDQQVHLLASGTYDGRDASFVVLRTGEQFEVLAYDPNGCDLLARDSTTG